ncbi:hypothetical protein IEO21_09913 [Rhodonia placenta]|uniref:C2H2-type domain-containing protein n=1 Tax=Rhodonia placenta TaxID=104341 RepID=A0A8H7NTV1_9APHY|nr:hypothetical protein IEO21_09913 [Postia placenta]
MPHPSEDQGSPHNIVFISDNMPPLPDHNEDLIAQHRSDPTNLLDASVNIIANLHALLSSAGTNVVSSVVTSDLHKVEQNATKTGNAHCIADAIVESNVDVQHIIDKETIQADREYDGHILVETPPSACLLSSLHQPGLHSHVKSQVRHKLPEVQEVQNQGTSATMEVSLRRNNRNRERAETTPSTTPIHSEQPLKRARFGNTPTSKGKTAAVVVSKPEPIAMADGRFACPHCPAQQFQRYNDCRRHIDMRKRCLGWNGILYPCRRCGKKYTRPDAAKRHMDDKPNCGQKGGRKKGDQAYWTQNHVATNGRPQTIDGIDLVQRNDPRIIVADLFLDALSTIRYRIVHGLAGEAMHHYHAFPWTIVCSTIDQEHREGHTSDEELLRGLRTQTFRSVLPETQKAVPLQGIFSCA